MRQGDNQHTTPPFTESEFVERFKALTKGVDGGSGQAIDWHSLFLEYVRSDKSKYKSVTQFAKAKGISPSDFQFRGGKGFWNQARANVHGKAMAKALGKSEDALAVKYGKQLRIVGKLEDAIEYRVDQIRAQQDENLKNPEKALVNPFESAAIQALIDGIDKLTKTNLLLNGSLPQSPGVAVQVNLHQALVKAVQERDAEFGLPG